MSTALRSGWQLTSTPTGSIADPDALASAAPTWIDAVVPGSVAGSITDEAVDTWGTDWWFRTTIDLVEANSRLRFDGVATHATAWLDGRLLGHHRSALRAWEIDLGDAAPGDHELVVVCRGLDAFEPPTRPRQRWRTRLVPDARLRWTRTPLWGHMPGWTPPCPAVGPYRDVHLVPPSSLDHLADGARCRDTPDGLAWSIDTVVSSAHTVERAWSSLGDQRVELTVEPIAGGTRLLGGGVAEVAHWWPHTHGRPALHEWTLELTGPTGTHAVRLRRVGRRSITVDRSDGGFALAVNGVPVFARGACWTPLDARRLWSATDALRRALTQVVDAGCNTVRILGVTMPETETFHDLCDELGVLVWFDLPYANFDHPFADPAFADEARAELEAQARLLARHPSTAVVCGGSEIHQQAAMMGLSAERRTVPFLEDDVPVLLADAGLDVPYVPSTPWGGALPFRVSEGVSHYYGIGAYRRGLDDVRRSDVRFTTECLAFAGVPARETLAAWTADGQLAPHDPRWKARVPRDRGVGWDFEDIRDHYVRELAGVDPMSVRSADVERYLDLGRAAVAEAVDAALRDMRRVGSRCAGALVFTLRDPWHGAGWGHIDVTGRPKSGWHVLARRFAPRTCFLTDEGLDGLDLHVVNDLPEPLEGSVRLCVVGRHGHIVVEGDAPVSVPGHAAVRMNSGELLPAFHDVTWAYRFGPLEHVAVTATLVDATGTVVARDVWTPVSALTASTAPPVGLRATAVRHGDDVQVTVASDDFAPWVHLEVPGWVPDDDWFHLAGGDEVTVRLRPLDPSTTPTGLGTVRSLAGTRPVVIDGQAAQSERGAAA